jgi:quercetin dioxygenase-like cupin family protein
MGEPQIEFKDMPWVDVAPGARERAATRGATRLRMLELGPGFVVDGWCRRGHLGLVVSGEVELTLADGVHRLRAGDGLALPAGEAGAHRARAVGGPACLFLVEEQP